MKRKILALTMAFFYLVSSFTVFASEESSSTSESAATSVEIANTGMTNNINPIQSDSDRGTVIESDSEDSLELVSEGSILMEASTGAILYSKNAEQEYYPASITKVMTTLVAVENSNLTDKLTYSADTLNAVEQGSSRVGVIADETMTVEDALYGVMLLSGNDTAAGVAEHIGGSIENFVDMMNAKAKELGCTNTNFKNPHGLPDEEHYTCAKDMALIVKAAVENPDFCKIASAINYTIPKTNKSEARELWNHHKMLLPASEYHYDGVAEGKTGYTTVAWNTLVTTAEKDGMKLIAVNLKCQGAAAAYNDTKKLFNYGFENYNVIKPLKNLTLKSLAEASDISIGEISNLEELSPAYNQDYSILAPAEITADDISIRLTNDGQEQGVWGSIHFAYGDNEIGTANIYYDQESELAFLAEDENSPKAQTVAKLPFILTAVIVVLILFIIYLLVSILRRR